MLYFKCDLTSGTFQWVSLCCLTGCLSAALILIISFGCHITQLTHLVSCSPLKPWGLFQNCWLAMLSLPSFPYCTCDIFFKKKYFTFIPVIFYPWLNPTFRLLNLSCNIHCKVCGIFKFHKYHLCLLTKLLIKILNKQSQTTLKCSIRNDLSHWSINSTLDLVPSYNPYSSILFAISKTF